MSQKKFLKSGVVLTMSENLRNALEEEGIKTDIMFAFPSGDDKGRFYVDPDAQISPIEENLVGKSLQWVKVMIVEGLSVGHKRGRICKFVCNANGCKLVCF